MIDGERVTRRLLAHYLGVSEQMVGKYVEMGMPLADPGAKGKPAGFDVRACFAWWVEHIAGKRAERAARADTAARESEIDLELKEIRLRRERAAAIDREAAVHVIRGQHTQTAALLRQAPRRYAAEILNLPDLPSAVEALTRIVDDQLRDLRLPEAWRELVEGVDGGAAA